MATRKRKICDSVDRDQAFIARQTETDDLDDSTVPLLFAND